MVLEVADHVHRPRVVLRPRHARSRSFRERLGYAESFAARPVIQYEVVAVDGNLLPAEVDVCKVHTPRGEGEIGLPYLRGYKKKTFG